MTISATDVFDKVSAYVRKNHGNVESLTIPYCSLKEDYPSKKKVYRVQIEMKIKGDIFPLSKTAIAEVDPENGNITMFKDGYTWTYWA